MKQCHHQTSLGSESATRERIKRIIAETSCTSKWIGCSLVGRFVHLSKSDYEKLRVKSIHDVKATNGSIDILEAVNELEDKTLSD